MSRRGAAAKTAARDAPAVTSAVASPSGPDDAIATLSEVAQRLSGLVVAGNAESSGTVATAPTLGAFCARLDAVRARQAELMSSIAGAASTAGQRVVEGLTARCTAQAAYIAQLEAEVARLRVAAGEAGSAGEPVPLAVLKACPEFRRLEAAVKVTKDAAPPSSSATCAGAATPPSAPHPAAGCVLAVYQALTGVRILQAHPTVTAIAAAATASSTGSRSANTHFSTPPLVANALLGSYLCATTDPDTGRGEPCARVDTVTPHWS
jgi:hypothetical protein